MDMAGYLYRLVVFGVDGAEGGVSRGDADEEI